MRPAIWNKRSKSEIRPLRAWVIRFRKCDQRNPRQLSSKPKSFWQPTKARSEFRARESTTWSLRRFTWKSRFYRSELSLKRPERFWSERTNPWSSRSTTETLCWWTNRIPLSWAWRQSLAKTKRTKSDLKTFKINSRPRKRNLSRKNKNSIKDCRKRIMTRLRDNRLMHQLWPFSFISKNGLGKTGKVSKEKTRPKESK